jgi:hypothetical protein
MALASEIPPACKLQKTSVKTDFNRLNFWNSHPNGEQAYRLEGFSTRETALKHSVTYV